jgi:hypothetical protein
MMRLDKDFIDNFIGHTGGIVRHAILYMNLHKIKHIDYRDRIVLVIGVNKWELERLSTLSNAIKKEDGSIQFRMVWLYDKGEMDFNVLYQVHIGSGYQVHLQTNFKEIDSVIQKIYN